MNEMFRELQQHNEYLDQKLYEYKLENKSLKQQMKESHVSTEIARKSQLEVQTLEKEKDLYLNRLVFCLFVIVAYPLYTINSYNESFLYLPPDAS